MNSTLERSLVHTYGDKPYKHSALANHRGTVVAFAMDDQRRIYYSVLDLAQGDMAQGGDDASEIDANFWLANPKPVAFPSEIEQAGFAVLDPVKMPAVKDSTTEEVAAGSVPNDELDPFLSSTARLTADAPFQVLSDGKHVYLFRQAIGSDDESLHPLHKREDGGATAGTDGRLADDAGAPVPLVDRTLLVDRYVLAGAELKRTREVRYRRSRNRTRPASSKDSLGAKDMTGNPFYEPTKEVDFVGSLTPGNVSVLLLPTIRTDEQRWQIFAFDAETDEVRSVNCARDGDGFFDTQDLKDIRFTLEGRTAGAGLAAELYYEQEQLPTEDVGKTVKQHARVLLCAATRATGDAEGAPSYVAAVDLAVTRDGTLTEIASEAEKKQHKADRKHTGESGPPKTPITAEQMGALEDEIEDLERKQAERDALRDQIAYVNKQRSATFYQHADQSGKSFKLYAGHRDRQIDARDMALTSGADEPPKPLIGYVAVTDEDTVVKFYPEHDLGGEPWTVTESGSSDGWPHEPGSVEVLLSHDLMRMGSSALQSQAEMEGLPADLDTRLTEKRAQRDASVVRPDSEPTPASSAEKPASLREIPMPVLAARTADVSHIEETLAEIGRHEDRLSELDSDIRRAIEQIRLINEEKSSAGGALHDVRAESVIQGDIDGADSDIKRLDSVSIRATIYDQDDISTNGAGKLLSHTFWPSTHWPSSKELRVGDRYSNLANVNRVEDGDDDHNWDDEIQYVDLGSEYIKLTLWWHPDFNGDKLTVTSTGKISKHWYDKASSLELAYTDRWHAEKKAAQGKLDNARSELRRAQKLRRDQEAAARKSTDELERQRVAWERERTQALSRLSELRRVHSEKRLPQPLVHCHTDGRGLTIRSGLLQFAYTDAPPVLFESAIGRVSMYFKGVNDQFFAAYYDIRTSRATWALSAKLGAIGLTSQTADVGYNGATVTVSDGSHSDLCTIEIRNSGTGVVEHWPDVPRDAETVSAVLNGTAMKRELVGRVATRNGALSGSAITLEDGAMTRVPAHALLIVEPPEDTESAKRTEEVVLKFKTTEATPSGQREISVRAGAVPDGSTVFVVRYDAGRARVTPSGYSLGEGSLSVVAKLQGAEGAVQNGQATLVTNAHCPSWVADAPGTAFVFDGEKQYLHSETPERFERDGDVTLEAWVHPIDVDGLAEVVHSVTPGGDRYALAVRTAESESALSFGRAKPYIEIPTLDSSALGPAFTVEAWVYLGDASVGKDQPILSDDGTGRQDAIHNGIELRVHQGKLYAGFASDGSVGTAHNSVHGNATIPQSEWTHVACTYESGGQLSVFVNGELDAAGQFEGSLKGRHPLAIGLRSHRSGHGVFGKIPTSDKLEGDLDEVRIWNVCRSPEAIQANVYRRLGGREPGLLAYYTFADGDTRDRSQNGHHGVLKGAGAPTVVTSPLPAFTCVAAVGRDVIETTRPISTGRWTHLAASFDQSYALRFDGDAYADAGKSAALDVTGDLTIEAFLQVDYVGRQHGILSKGALGSPEVDSEVPYAFYVDASGHLVFEMETGKGDPELFRSTHEIESGRFHRVAVVRKTDLRTVNAGGQGTSDNAPSRKEAEQFTTVTFYIDGDWAGSKEIAKAVPRGNDSPLYLGQARLAHNAVAQFAGAVSEIRIYSQALESDQVGKALGRDQHGLTAWWRMEENQGHIAYDSKGDAHARLYGPAWMESPQPNGSAFKLYVDGQLAETTTDVFEARPDFDASTPQFTLGGRQSGADSGQPGRLFNGLLEEVRIWKGARRQEQILDNLFTRLRGETRDLIAYYTFDDVARSEDGTATHVEDSGPKGNHLHWATDETPTEVLSTAPVSADTAEVRSALSGVHTDFHTTMDGRAAAAEYADLQRDAEGHLRGVHKRCYAYVQDGRWMLVTGYKVGNIRTEWVGQAQFDPQVMGYIEGGPPVPSENFTEGAIELNYGGTNEVALVESNNVTATVSSSHEDSIQTGFEVEASAGMKFKTSLVAAPLGAGISTELPEVTVKGEVTGGANANGAWAGGESLGRGVNTSTAKSVAVGGGWDQATDSTAWANPDYTRRWVPSNMGFAFVQSETADVFALRLEHTGTLVGLRMLPNPDIPKDTNIIPFPINNRYTKQGTLNGQVGSDKDGNVVVDPDFTGANQPSYFKPMEAYQLKRRVQEEEQKLKAYFASFDSTPQE
ncbi:LamG-like jellyroll fold domain-containing protein, partial [Rubrivirga sp.]|uniref:LamG-like jellyroll fold domain-containing protein n=1 Tax=Rubrivirga sp. TaxID=1885344 RepID=UPI003C7452FD